MTSTTNQENQNEQVKLCSKCTVVKPLQGGYYKAGKSWQKLCKLCHNARRIEYANNQVYKPKATGFMKYPEELRKKIIYDIHVRVNFKDITKKYKADYPMINHQSLLRFNRLKQIPEYKE